MKHERKKREMTKWDREEIEEMKPVDFPQVRCRFDAIYVDEDGRQERGKRDINGCIVIDGNNPWLVIQAAGVQHSERFSWGLVLEVLNDRFSHPIEFQQEFEYQV